MSCSLGSSYSVLNSSSGPCITIQSLRSDLDSRLATRSLVHPVPNFPLHYCVSRFNAPRTLAALTHPTLRATPLLESPTLLHFTSIPALRKVTTRSSGTSQSLVYTTNPCNSRRSLPTLRTRLVLRQSHTHRTACCARRKHVARQCHPGCLRTRRTRRHGRQLRTQLRVYAVLSEKYENYA